MRSSECLKWGRSQPVGNALVVEREDYRCRRGCVDRHNRHPHNADKSRWSHSDCKLYYQRQRVGAAPRVAGLV